MSGPTHDKERAGQLMTRNERANSVSRDQLISYETILRDLIFRRKPRQAKKESLFG